METINIRRFIIQAIIILLSSVILIQLFIMQVTDESYAAMAQNNVIRDETIYPSRGQVIDRNGHKVVNNEAVYDIIFIPRQVQELDTNKLCQLLAISKTDFINNLKKVRKSKGYNPLRPQTLFKQIPASVFSKFQEYLYQFPGFYTQVRAVRSYPFANAAHLLGYIGEVNQKQIDASEYYEMGDYIGISGIERTYEKILRGEKGLRKNIVDVHNREIGSYLDGEKDKEAVAGQDIQLTIDINLQSYVEELMKNKKGGVVAIEPSTGEILTLVSAPYYDPNRLTGKKLGIEMAKLKRDTLKPLFNRALMSGLYPPGSTFKPLMALIGLQEKAFGPNFGYGCGGGYRLSASQVIGCHGHASAYNVKEAIKHSCNAYFCRSLYLFLENDKYPGGRREGLTKWVEHLADFGLGVKLPVDLPNTSKGMVPTSAYYDTVTYKREIPKSENEPKWKSNWIISLGIGQGELGVTPLQLAHMTSIIANRGTYYYPHIVRPEKWDTSSIYTTPYKVSVEKKYFDVVVDGMEGVVTGGTARIARIDDIAVCGKTGTAENPHGEDHSLFIAFAPKDNPKIAIGVMVENAGFGSRFGAPIASLTIEKYLTGEISEKRQALETKILEANLIK